MKNKKKIILAAGAAALGLVAATGATSGFAWFATNATVSVSGLQIGVKSDQPFLLIGEGTQNLEQLRGTPTKTVTIHETTDGDNPTLAKLNPVTYEGTTKTISACDTLGNWAAATSDNLAQPQVGNDTTRLGTADTAFANAVLTDYVKTYTFSICLAAGSGEVGGLQISAVDVTPGKGLKVIIASATAGFDFDTSADTVSGKVLDSDGVSLTDVVTIKAYVYLEGKDANVYSNNMANLGGTVGFSISTYTAPAQNQGNN